MTAKICFKCGIMKPLNNYYRHIEMEDGRIGKCKACAKKDSSDHYRNNREHYAEYEHQRFQNPERKKAVIEYQRKRREKNPEKYRANTAVHNAIRDGRLSKEPCEICGHKTVEGHHRDYLKPLEVFWLCRKHYLLEHNRTSYGTLL